MSRGSGKRIAAFGAAVAALLVLAGWLLFGARSQDPRGGRDPVSHDALASSPGGVTSAPTSRADSLPAPVRPRALPELASEQMGSVSGDVVDALGDPIAGAEVWVAGESNADRRTKTDAAGIFSLEALPFGDSCMVRARAAGRNEAYEYVHLSLERPREGVHFRLWDAGTIRGRVTDATSGEPIAGARVGVSYDGARLFGFEPQAETVTGPDGRFEVSGVTLGTIVVRAVAAGHVMGSRTVRLSSTTEADLALEPGAGSTLAVTAVGLDAAGLKDAKITVIAYDNGSARSLPSSLLRGRFDDQGIWSVAGLPDYEFLVMVHAEGWVFQPNDHRVKQKSADRAVEFHALREGAVVMKGTLKDDAGRALPGETIITRAANSPRRTMARTAADGTFSVPSTLAPGEKGIFYLVNSNYVLHQEKDPRDFNGMDMRNRAWHEAIVDPAASLDLVAIPTSRVLGRVVAEGGRPIAGAKVELEHTLPRVRDMEGKAQWRAFARTSTKADGTFTFEGLHAVDDEMRASVADRAGAGFSRTFKLEGGKSTEGVDVALATSGIVSGVVRDAHGDPAPGARLWLLGSDQQSRSSHSGNTNEVLSDRAGRFRFAGVGPGTYTVTAVLGDGRPRVTPRSEKDRFRVDAGARVEREVVLP